MRDSNEKVSLSQRIMAGLAVATVLFLVGCGDFFDEKTAFMESQRIRDDVREIKAVVDPNVFLPNVYTSPPKIVEQVVGGQPEWKLSYFCKHHLSEQLTKIVNEQFATKAVDKKGNSITVPDYTISSNSATNHLVATCPSRNDVEAVLELLEMIDVPPVQVKIECLISELYADDTLDWETTIEIGDLLGEDITAGGSARLFGADVLDLVTETMPLPAFPGASLREVARAKMGLKVGYSSVEHDFLAVVDILESRGYLKVLMNPTLEIVNGRTAKIISSEKVPLDKIFLHDREGFIETKTDYVDVVDSLEITPHVFAGGYIGLETTAVLGSKSIPDGVKQIRIVSKREIYNQENRIRPGESLVIGGIRKSAEHTVVRGVPFLKDIPLIGVLFSSKDFEERAVETMFILTPTISSGGMPHKEMVEEIRRKHGASSPESMEGAVLDPFGFKASEKKHDRKILQAEDSRIEAEAEKAKAEIEKLKAEVQKVKEDIKKSKEEAEAEQAEAEAEQAEAEADDKEPRAEAEKKEETETQEGKS
ncbi:MAG: type II secretion system protein GspD [Planctomycetota bacterium]|jgi:hypothetical protein